MAINDCDRISDRIWFTIFHELGHVIKNHKRHFVVSLDNDESTEEKEADLFARNTLIDPKHLQAFVSKGAFDLDSICHFAEQEGVSKVIIIGRLTITSSIPICTMYSKTILVFNASFYIPS